jgi:threonine aldolase
MSYLYLFRDDYSEGAHPKVLEALSRTNAQQESAYGVDSFSLQAEQLIKEKINKPNAHVHFVSTGTQANLVSFASFLKPYESVIAADTGHPNVHEAGAIEATGHKINIIPGVEGRLTAKAIQEIVSMHTNEHMVKPRALYISQATELGTIYGKKQLQELSQLCKQAGLYFYIDGARIGNAIMAKSGDCDLSNIADLCDMFYIGGTKNGALFGEAIVIVNPNLQENFRYHLKQRGALLAKTRAISVQFSELFKNDLYFENAKHANVIAQELAAGIEECGYSFLSTTSTNQIFPILPNSIIEKLQQTYAFYSWPRPVSVPDSSAIRLCTSWATPKSAVQKFLSDLKKLS